MRTSFSLGSKTRTYYTSPISQYVNSRVKNKLPDTSKNVTWPGLGEMAVDLPDESVCCRTTTIWGRQGGKKHRVDWEELRATAGSLHVARIIINRLQMKKVEPVMREKREPSLFHPVWELQTGTRLQWEHLRLCWWRSLDLQQLFLGFWGVEMRRRPWGFSFHKQQVWWKVSSCCAQLCSVN